jgi:tryptophan-rich sensory protein
MKFRWTHGVLFFVGAQVVSFGLAAVVKAARARSKKPAIPPPDRKDWEGTAVSEREEPRYYKELRQPIFAPPSSAFAPAWTANCILSIWGLQRVLNMPRDRPGRREFLASQAVSWLCFVSFSAAFFSLRSPINSAIITTIDLASTVTGLGVAIARLKDRDAALSLSTLTPWLMLATPTAHAVAAWNRDEFYQVGPFLNPPRGWQKKTNR